MKTSLPPSLPRPAPGILQELKDRIGSGFYAPGKQLPTVKQLMTEYGVSHVTILRCIRQLQGEGYVRAVPRKGVFANLPRRASVEAATALRVLVFLVWDSQGPEGENSDVSVHDYWERHLISEILLGLQDGASLWGATHRIIFIPRRLVGSAEALCAYAASHLNGENAAMFLGDGITGELADRLTEALGLPVLFNSPELKRPCRHNLVTIDTYHGACLVMEHLIAQGHQRIAMIGASGPTSAAYEGRLAGCRDTLKRHRLKWVDELYITCPETLPDMRRAASRILTLSGSHRPSAVFAFNDLRALIFRDTANQAGVQIPADIALAGFDGTREAIGQGITTVQIPFYQSGLHALVLLHSLVNGRIRPPLCETLGGGLIAGPSTARLPLHLTDPQA